MLPSRHENIGNVVGGFGCLSENGILCRACCLDPNNKNSACKLSTREGCKIHDSPKQLHLCKNFHCSVFIRLGDNFQILSLLKRAVADGTIDRPTSERQKTKLLK